MSKIHVCPICGKDYEDGRKLHGHLMRSHQEEYRAAGFDKTKLQPGPQGGDKPAGFRPLNLKDYDEKRAYDQGYRFIDKFDNIYTHSEAQGEGWI